MNKINSKIKKYFKEFDIDIEEIFEKDPDSIIEENISDPVAKQILSKINDVASTNNTHKLLFAAALLELRSQVKKNQEQTSEVRRQVEKGIKDLQHASLEHYRQQESLIGKIDFLQNSLSSILRVVTRSKSKA